MRRDDHTRWDEYSTEYSRSLKVCDRLSLIATVWLEKTSKAYSGTILTTGGDFHSAGRIFTGIAQYQPLARRRLDNDTVRQIRPILMINPVRLVDHILAESWSDRSQLAQRLPSTSCRERRPSSGKSNRRSSVVRDLQGEKWRTLARAMNFPLSSWKTECAVLVCKMFCLQPEIVNFWHHFCR